MTGAARRPDVRCYVAEALGTFVLVAIGCGAVMVAATSGACGVAGLALAFGLVVSVGVAASGHLGGAHVNPAVTLGFWSVRRFPGREVAPYIIAQCTGAVAASMLLRWLLGDAGNFGATVPSLSLSRTFVLECGYSGLLGFVIMAVATDARVPGMLAPFVLGATVFAGPLTGGSFNPARSLGPAIAGGVWTAHWLYWVAPILGMAGGMHLYERLRGVNEPPTEQHRVTGVEGPL